MAPSDSETVGFIDVGTNSIHLLVVRFYRDSAGTAIFQDKESVRLGQSLYSTGRIADETIQKGALVISRFAQISRNLGADKVVAYATCAAREAVNRDDLISAISKDPGLEVKVIPGTEEARLISLGVFGVHGPEERSIVIDIGGGSTELAIREKGEDLFLDSLSMGAVRYAYGLGIDCTAKVSDADYDYMLRRVDLSSYHAVNKVRSIGFRKAIGSSGTMIALAEICAARRGDKDSSYFLLSELVDAMKAMRSMDADSRRAVPGLGKNRVDIIIGGGAVAEELMSQFGIEKMEISTSGLKQGMQLDHMLSSGYGAFNTREASVMALAHRCSYDEAHAENVRRNALQLFDQSKELELHEMGDGFRNLLSCASLLHDIGELISYNDHNYLSQMIIENADLVGFSIDEIHAMGLMVRFHHKKFPGAKDSSLAGLPPELALSIRRCAMFLRLADVSDRHRNGAVKALHMREMSGCTMLELDSDQDLSMELWSMDKLRNDFLKLFGSELVLKEVRIGQ